jgi:hypothetical protein
VLLEKLPSIRGKTLPDKEDTECWQYIVPPWPNSTRIERETDCFSHTFACILTMQELTSTCNEAHRRFLTSPPTGNVYWILKSRYKVKMKLTLWHLGRKK